MPGRVRVPALIGLALIATLAAVRTSHDQRPAATRACSEQNSPASLGPDRIDLAPARTLGRAPNRESESTPGATPNAPTEGGPASQHRSGAATSRQPRSPDGIIQAARADRADVLIHKGSDLGFNNGFYTATFRPDGVDFAPPSPATGPAPFEGGASGATGPAVTPTVPRLHVEMDAVIAGGRNIASTGEITPVVSPGDRRVDYVRGPVTERYILYEDALEQMFIINHLPDGPSQIDVRVRITTPAATPPNGTTSRQLVFGGVSRMESAAGGASVSGGEVTISGAVVFDAQGRTLHVPMTWSDGILQITLPSAWVAAAKLPIVVDPTLGAAILIDDSTGSTWGRVTNVAYNSVNDEWLVVWNEQVGASGFDWDVYARRVSGAGTTIGPAIPVDTDAASSCEGAVAYDSTNNHFLIVWRRDPADPYWDNNVILGRLLAGGSTSFIGPAAVVGDTAIGDINPRVANVGSSYYVCWISMLPSLADWNVHGRFVSFGMTPGATADPDATTPDRADYPWISYDAGSGLALVAWEAGPAGSRDVRYRVLNPATQTFITPGASADVSGDASHVSAAGNGSGWLCVWDENISATTSNVVGRQILAGGAPAGAPYVIAPSIASATWWGPANVGGWPAVDFSPSSAEYLVAWFEYVAAFDSDSLKARPVTLGNSVGEEQTVAVATSTLDATWPAIARRLGTEEYLIAAWDSWSPGAMRAWKFVVNEVGIHIVVLSGAEPAPGNTNQITLTVQAQNEAGVPTPVPIEYSAWVTMSGQATGSTLASLPAGATSTTITVNDTAAEVVSVSLIELTSTPFIEVGGTATFIAGPATTAVVKSTTEVGTASNASVPVTIRIEDGYGNPVSVHAPYTATVVDDDNLTTLSPTSISIPNGVASTTITATELGNAQHVTTISLTNTSGLNAQSGTVHWFNGGNGGAAQVRVVSATEAAPGDGNSITLVIRVEDAAGNLMSNHAPYAANVTLSGTAWSSSSITIPSGVASVTLAVNCIRAEVVDVGLVETSGTLLTEIPGTATFIAGPAVRARVLSTVEPPPGDGNSAVVTIQIEDNFGNPQPVHSAYAAIVTDDSPTATVAGSPISIPSGTSSATITVNNTAIAETVWILLTETSSTSLANVNGQVTFTTPAP